MEDEVQIKVESRGVVEKMVNYIYACSLSKERYVAEGVAKVKFIKAVAEDSGQPESAIVPERVRDGDSMDFEMAYHNFKKIVKFDSESGEVLKIL